MNTSYKRLIKFPYQGIKKPLNDLMNSQIIRAKMIRQLETTMIKVI